ncbi:MAG: SirB2 family protein [Pseudomonadales bacterium]
MSELYPMIKQWHMFFAAVSLLSFLVRSGLKFAGSSLLNKKPVKILPHINDSLLLLCGVALAVIAGYNPLVQHWLLAKLVLLVMYIGCGLYVMKWSRGNAQRAGGVLMALLCFMGMGFLAVAKPF